MERVTRDGSDREARFNLMSASMQAAMAFQTGVGCVHSLSHSLGGVDPRLHHGTLNAMFLPAVVRFNAQAESVQKANRLDRMARAMGLPSGGDIAEAITDMNARLGLPTGLAAMGVERGWFDHIIKGALADHCHGTNPRIASVGIMKRCWSRRCKPFYQRFRPLAQEIPALAAIEIVAATLA